MAARHGELPGGSPIPGSAGGEVRKILHWGRCYSGTGDSDAAVEGVLRAFESEGLRLQERVSDGGWIRLRGVQGASRGRIARRRLLQDVHVAVGSGDGRLRVAFDTRMFRWYLRETVFLAACVVAAMVLGMVLLAGGALPESASTGLVILGVLVPAITGLFLCLARLSVLGSDSFGRELVRRIAEVGGDLEPEGLGSNWRYRQWALAFLTGALTSMGGLLLAQWMSTPGPPLGVGLWVFLVLLTASAVVLLSTLIPLGRQPGFGHRMPFILSGIVSSVVLLIWLCLPLGWWHATYLGVWAFGVDDEMLRAHSRFLIVVTLLFGAAVLAGSAWLLRASRTVLDATTWSHAHRDWQVLKAATGEASLVRTFQWLLLTVWLLVGGLVLVGQAASLLALRDALVAPRPAGWTDLLIETTNTLIASALGLPAKGGVDPFSRVGWFLYGAANLGLLGLSVGHLGWARWRRRREYERLVARSDGPEHAALRDLCGRLAREAGGIPVRPVVLEGAVPEAWAVRYGLFRNRRYVVLSGRAFGALTRPQVAALLAHEIAHHRYRRPDRDALLQWIGRFTLVGDGFTRAVQHSLGYELEADRLALQLLDGIGIDPSALRSALGTLRHFPVLPPRPLPGDPGLPAWRHLDTEIRAGGRPTLAEGARIFLAQYTGGLNLSYFHPTTDERMETLSRLERELRSDPKSIEPQPVWDL